MLPRAEVVLRLDEVVEHCWFSASEIGSLSLPPDLEIMLPAAFSWLGDTGV